MKNNIKKKAASEKIKPHDIFRYSAIKVEYTTESLSWPNLLIISAAMSPFKGEFAPVNNLLILMVVDGVMAGKWILDGETSDINLAPGELLIVPPDVYFSVDIVSECKLLALYVGQNILKELFVKYSTSGALFYSIEYNPHVRDDFLATIIFEMKKITECIDNFSLMNVQLLTRTVVGKIISNYSVVEYSNVDIGKKISVYKMRKILSHIDDNIDKNIFVGQLAGMAGLSGAQFVRLFKRAMNITPHQYIIRRRVDTAKKLLMATDASIAVIAQECGFSDQMHLTKCFSRLVGTSPAAYRRSRTS